MFLPYTIVYTNTKYVKLFCFRVINTTPKNPVSNFSGLCSHSLNLFRKSAENIKVLVINYEKNSLIAFDATLIESEDNQRNIHFFLCKAGMDAFEGVITSVIIYAVFICGDCNIVTDKAVKAGVGDT